jgi:hypothetical protein
MYKHIPGGLYKMCTIKTKTSRLQLLLQPASMDVVHNDNDIPPGL